MAVQVSGVHLVGAEVDPEPLRGIKTFVRDILPHRPHASPEGGTTPVLSDPGLEDTWTDNSHLKRKSCIGDDESADSDASDSEHLPSNKRQRITVSAMRRLFAKVSLSDTDEASHPASVEAPRSEALPPSPQEATPRHSPEREDTPQHDTEGYLDESRTDTQDTDSNQYSAKTHSEKRLSETDTGEEHEDKRQKTSDHETSSEDDDKETREAKEGREENEDHKEETGEEEAEETVAKPEDTSKTNKRQADTQESDTEGKEETGNKVKRTRRLRRGLRLCTNITCYIEQVLYN